MCIPTIQTRLWNGTHTQKISSTYIHLYSIILHEKEKKRKEKSQNHKSFSIFNFHSTLMVLLLHIMYVCINIEMRYSFG